MSIKTGEKIRQLRRKNGKTQEDLARVLGVTCQAVSRWEANGGYPDMDTLPVIANYFHVTIDELFGYLGDREEKINTILATAEKEIISQKDMAETVFKLRKAAEEFPDHPQILLNLGFALHLQGWQQCTVKSYINDKSYYIYEDCEYYSQNTSWQEELQIFEQLLEMELSPNDREVIILLMVRQYAKMGTFDKAKVLAQKQNSILVSRECLLTKATAGDQLDLYQGEALIALMNQLTQVLSDAIFTKAHVLTTKKGLQTCLSLIDMYESIFDDGLCGSAHTNLRDLYLGCMLIQAQLGDIEQAMVYFEKAFYHHKTYESIRCTGEYHYTAALVSKVIVPSESFPASTGNFWSSRISGWPDALRQAIKEDGRLAECFADE